MRCVHSPARIIVPLTDVDLTGTACAATGLPLIVHERFLTVYDFIPRNAVEVAGPGGDASAMDALMSMPAHQFEEKLWNVSSPLGHLYAASVTRASTAFLELHSCWQGLMHTHTSLLAGSSECVLRCHTQPDWVQVRMVREAAHRRNGRELSAALARRAGD